MMKMLSSIECRMSVVALGQRPKLSGTSESDAKSAQQAVWIEDVYSAKGTGKSTNSTVRRRT